MLCQDERDGLKRKEKQKQDAFLFYEDDTLLPDSLLPDSPSPSSSSSSSPTAPGGSAERPTKRVRQDHAKDPFFSFMDRFLCLEEAKLKLEQRRLGVTTENAVEL